MPIVSFSVFHTDAATAIAIVILVFDYVIQKMISLPPATNWPWLQSARNDFGAIVFGRKVTRTIVTQRHTKADSLDCILNWICT